MRRAAMVVVAVVGVLATACYQDFDFDADHKADFIYVHESDWVDAETGAVIFDGQPGDVPAPADYDGDHNFDVAVVRGGSWITVSAAGTISYPAPAQLPAFAGTSAGEYQILPVPGDYDGDGDDEPAWYRDSDASWFIEGQGQVVFGNGPSALPGTLGALPDQDFPVPADYDGDEITDLATFSPRSYEWKVRMSSTGRLRTWTLPGNPVLAFPVPADYDGVGHAQVAVIGSDGLFIAGRHDPIPIPDDPYANFPAIADYDGDDKADMSVTSFDEWLTPGQPTHPIPEWAVPVASRNLAAVYARFTYVRQSLLEDLDA